MQQISKIYGAHYDSPVGQLIVKASDVAILGIQLSEPNQRYDANELTDLAVKQLDAYFAGHRHDFSLPLDSSKGTPFQRAVWEALQAIPFGEVRSYGAIASELDHPKAARAVGGACNKNPFLIVVPCHRVVGATGKLTGFACGLESKEQLLAHETAYRQLQTQGAA